MIYAMADKHPEKPTRAFFVDSENGAEKLLEGMEFLTASDLVVVFHRGGFPAGLKNKLELGPSAIEWVRCVDLGVKNSMDVQIIAELSMRFAKDGFERAFIVSEDKGFLPADHYLQQTTKGRESEIALVKSVGYAAMRAVLLTLTELKRASGIEDVGRAFALLYGESEAQGLVEALKEAFADCAVGGSEIQEAGTAASGDFDALTVGKLGALPISRSDEATFVDLPGIGWALAGKLESAGIGSSVELEQMGLLRHGDAFGFRTDRFRRSGLIRSRPPSGISASTRSIRNGRGA